MRKVNKSWMAPVAAALLLGTLAGVVWARPHDRPQAADITRKVTLTGCDFVPQDESMSWSSYAYCVECHDQCWFAAPVVFPCLPAVIVERLQLHATDSNASAFAHAVLYRAQPQSKRYVQLGSVETPDGTAPFQTYTSPDINEVVWPSQRAYVWLAITGPNIVVYGVTVEYHRNI